MLFDVFLCIVVLLVVVLGLGCSFKSVFTDPMEWYIKHRNGLKKDKYYKYKKAALFFAAMIPLLFSAFICFYFKHLLIEVLMTHKNQYLKPGTG